MIKSRGIEIAVLFCICILVLWFLCNNWLAVEEGDGKIERVLPAAGTENVTEFKNRFSDLMRINLTDGHLWYSLWSR